MNGLSIVILLVVFLCSTVWYLTKDDVSCIVSNSENSDVNGFYVARGGVYFKRNYGSSSIVDVFELLDLHRLRKMLPHSESDTTIMFSKLSWTINSNFNRKVMYTSSPANPEKYLYNPPDSSWKVYGKDGTLTDSSLMVHSCKGNLQNSPTVDLKGPQSNIEQMLAMPVTTALLGLIFYIAYYLYANRVDVSVVAYSYEAIASRGEYCKIISATLSHYDLMHLGFNTMALYQIGSVLEPIHYSSIVFLYSNVNLIFMTILIETAILYVLITRFNHHNLAESLSIGFSGVLFAWMTAESVRMNKYCPIFLFPSFCLDTFHIPIPNIFAQNPTDLTFDVPVNLGPFALLLFTKLIIPRSSFLGHLSGIIIGYPLAWLLLNWITPPVMVCFLAALYMWKERLFLFDRSSSANHDELFSNLAEFVNAQVLFYYHVFSLVGFLCIGVSVFSVLTNFNGYSQVVVRCVTAFLVIYAQLARKHSFTCSNAVTEGHYVKIMFTALVVMLVVFLYDTINMTAAFTSRNLFLGSGLTHHAVNTALLLNTILCITELSYLVLLLLNMYELPQALSFTSSMRMDKVSIEKDLERLGIMRLIRGAPQAFSGASYRLSGGTNESGIAMSPMPVNSSGSSSSGNSGGSVGTRSASQYVALRSGGRSSPSQKGTVHV